MKRHATLTLAGGTGMPRRGDGLLIDQGSPYEEVVRVIRVNGPEVTVSRWRWYHTWGSRARRWTRDAWHTTRSGAASAACSLRGHPLGIADICWCGKREELAPGWDEGEF